MTLFPETLSLQPSSRLTALQRLARKVDWVAVLVALVTFAGYLRTLAPSVLWSDWGEYQYSAYRLWVPHQTGYPLYILLGKLWTLLPVGDVAYRVNLMSACWGVATVVLTYLCVKRLTERRSAAAVGALSLAFSVSFWAQASTASVRTLHAAFAALITLFVIGIAQRRVSIEALALVVGLSLTHHRLSIFLLPGIIVALWWMRGQVEWTPRKWLAIVTLLLIPQALYLFVALGKEWGSAREFWRFVLALSETNDITSRSWAQVIEQYAQRVLPAVWNAFTPLGLSAALIGMGAFFRPGQARKDEGHPVAQVGVGLYLLLNWLICIAFAGIHPIDDPSHYLTHGFVLQTVALGAGWALAIDWLEARRWRPARIMRPAYKLLPFALPLFLAVNNLRAADFSGTGWIGPFTLDELTSIEANSTVIADWSFTMPYRYHQIVEGQRRDITLIMDNDQAAMDRADAKIKSGGAVYLRQRRVGNRWREQLPFVAADRLWRVLPTEPTFAPQPISISFGDAVTLTQVATWPAQLTTNRLMLLRLGWEIPPRAEHDFSVSLRLVNADQQIWLHQESPLRDSTGILSTTAWLLGPAMPPGDYHWQITVDDSSTSTNLGLTDLPSFRIAPPDQPAPLSSIVVDGHPSRQPDVAGWALVGYTSPVQEVQPGAYVTLPLFWQATGDATRPQTARLQLRERQGHIVAEQNIQLPQARVSDVIESRPAVLLPTRLSDGRYDFFVAGNTAVRLTFLNVKGRTHIYRAPPIAHPRQIQIGESIELLGYELSQPNEIKPGGKINLKLFWRAKGTMERGYKVFIHVMDAGGKLLVQKDGVPVNWALPTNAWVAGEIIVDPYDIPIPPEAASGDYGVQIGLYDPGNGQRLAAVENGSRLRDDSIPLVTLAIR
jgi:hypothetical protein